MRSYKYNTLIRSYDNLSVNIDVSRKFTSQINKSKWKEYPMFGSKYWTGLSIKVSSHKRCKISI